MKRKYKGKTVLCINNGQEIVIYYEGRKIGEFSFLPKAKGMVALSQQALIDPELHIGPTVRKWALDVARRQVSIYHEIIQGGMNYIQNKMEQLKMTHTAALIPELLADASREKTNHLDFIEKVFDMEVEAHEERRIAASLKISGLPKGLHLENFDFLFQPSVEKPRIDHLATCQFIRNHDHPGPVIPQSQHF